MNRRKPSIVPALCISLIAHGLGLSGLAWWLVETTPPPKLAALDKVSVMLASMPKTVLPKPQSAPQTPPPKPPAPAKKKPPEPVKFQKPQSPMKDDSGEAKGVGTANRSTDGNKPMLAHEGLEQADLMKDADQFAPDALLPASKGEARAIDAPPEKTPKPGAPSQEMTAETKPENGPGVSAPPSGTKTPKPKQQTAQADTPKPVQKEIRGHRATLSDTESVAFARAENRVFEAGKLEGRKGLRTRITTPRLGDASLVDLENLDSLHLVLGVTVNVDGDVQNVVVLESSGSANIDQDFKNAVWNYWNLEPRKDAQGNPTDLNWVITCR